MIQYYINKVKLRYYDNIEYNIIWCNIIQYDINSIIWYDMIWYNTIK